MRRDVGRLTDTSFDLVIVGGGIYGTTAAWDATQRGLSVAIIDRSDFGSGTSFNSLKTLHGGVRSLRAGNLTELRLFVRERRALSRIVPHLVQPLPFIIPTYGDLMRNRWFLRAGFALHDLLARDRNELSDPRLHLPPSRLLTREEYLALNPWIDPTGVTGGIEWHDCQMSNSDRVNLAFLQAATDAGAVAANYVEATGLLRDPHRVVGVNARDRLRDHALEIRGSVVLNCSGPWAPELLRTIAPEAAPSLPASLSLAMNLVLTRRLTDTHAVGGTAKNRLLFMVPWRDRTIIGTSHDPFPERAVDRPATKELVLRFLRDVGQAFPQAGLGPADIALVHSGLLPSVNDGAAVSLLKTSAVRDHREDGAAGLVSVLGVRYTTARATAQHAIDTTFRVLDKVPPPCRTAETPLAGGAPTAAPGGPRDGIADAGGEVSSATAQRLARSYGAGHRRLLDQLTAHPDDAIALGSVCPVTRGEIRHAAREEMAMTLADALLRRTEAGSAGHPGDDAVRSAAVVMARELGWSSDRTADEIQSVTALYRWDA